MIPFGPDGLNAGLTVTETEPASASAIPWPRRTALTPSIAPARAARSTIPASRTRSPRRTSRASWPASTRPVRHRGRPARRGAIRSPAKRKRLPGPGQDPFAPWDLPWALELANGDRCTLLARHPLPARRAGRLLQLRAERRRARRGRSRATGLDGELPGRWGCCLQPGRGHGGLVLTGWRAR